MFLQFAYLLPLVAIVPCFALPADIQITIHNGLAAAVSHQPHSSDSPNINVDDALKSINSFQKEATAVGHVAAKVLPLPSRDASKKEYDEWWNSLAAVHEALKNQTANMNALSGRLYDSETEFSIKDSVVVLKSVMELMNGLNQTEFDPLVQLSATKLSGVPIYRRYFLIPVHADFGGLVGWAKAMRETLLAYRIVFTHASGEWPGTIEQDFEKTYQATVSAIDRTPNAIEDGGWSEYNLMLGNNAFVYNHGSL